MSAEKSGPINLASEISEVFTLKWLSVSSNIDLALLFDDCSQPEETFISLLCSSERAELAVKTSGPGRRMWLMGRVVTKIVVAKRWKIEPNLVEVATGCSGRPELKFPLGGMAGCISISHTVGAAVSVVGAGPVGVDIEKIDRVLNERVIAWAFNPEELKFLESAKKFPGALSLWCAREAAAKSWGLGLLNHLNQVRVTGADWNNGYLTVSWLGGGLSQRAEVSLRVANGYLVALAT